MSAAADILAEIQHADGSFRMAPVPSRPPGGVGDDLFSTATVLAVAAPLLPPERVSRAADYLLGRRGETGLWAWGADGLLPPDSDDTACCLGALATVGVPLDAAREARLLRRFWRWRGPFRTWLGRGGWSARERDDVVVNCNILWALHALGVRPRRAEVRAVEGMLRAQDGATRYYCSPATVAWAAARAGLAAPGLDALACANERPLDCALWSLAGRIDAGKAASLLLDMREPDGGWPAEPWVQDHEGAWESRAVTLGFAIAALLRARTGG